MISYEIKKKQWEVIIFGTLWIIYKNIQVDTVCL